MENNNIISIEDEILKVLETEFEETRFSEILDKIKVPDDSTMYNRFFNLARIYYINGFIDACAFLTDDEE